MGIFENIRVWFARKRGGDIGVRDYPSSNMKLGDLKDVRLSVPTDTQALAYDASINIWKNAAGGGGSLATLSDVAVSSPDGSEVLSYNSITSKWENGAPVTFPPPQQVFSPSYLVWGSAVWISGYSFGVQGQVVFNGVTIDVPYTVVTLTAADVTDDRIDLIILTSSGTADKIEGTTATPAAEPDCDPYTQYKLSLVTVTNNTTTPTAITDITLYKEHTGGEWTYADYNSATIDPDSITSPHTGSKAIEATNPTSGNRFTLTAAAPFDPSTYSYVVMWIKPKAAMTISQYFNISCRLAGVVKGKAVTVKNNTFGFVSGTNAYQMIAIPLKSFALPVGTTIDGVWAVWISSVAHSGWYFDDITMQDGTVEVPSASTDHGQLFGLSDDDHTQYLLSAGRSGGQIITGGTGSGDDLILRTTSNVTKGSYILSELATTGYLKTDGSGVISGGHPDITTASLIIDGGGVAITTGVKADISIPFACTLTQTTLLADQLGAIAIDLWIDTYANYPPTDADSKTIPAIVATGTCFQSGDLSVPIAANSTIRYNVDSCATITRCCVSLTLVKI